MNLDIYDKEYETLISQIPTLTEFVCQHEDIIEENNNKTCSTCGEIIIQNILSSERQVNYSQQDFFINKIQVTKLKKKELCDYSLSEKMMNETIDLYDKIVQDRVYRGKIRQAIIIYCVYILCKKNNSLLDIEEINFRLLPRSYILCGSKIVHSSKYILQNENLIIKNNFKDSLIMEMNKFFSSNKDIDEVLSLYEKIKNNGEIFNTSKPHSIICGLIYIWILKSNQNININDFIGTIKISMCTLNKIKEKIEKIIGCEKS